MSFAMTPAEREAFLKDVHVAIIAIADEGRGPLAVPIWYSYEPTGEIQIVTDRDSRKGELIARHRRFSLCVQTETSPYRYVSVEGPVTAIEPVDVEKHLRPVARRYLGEQDGGSVRRVDRRPVVPDRHRGDTHAAGALAQRRLRQAPLTVGRGSARWTSCWAVSISTPVGARLRTFPVNLGVSQQLRLVRCAGPHFQQRHRWEEQ
jgi:hypothetical protein